MEAPLRLRGSRGFFASPPLYIARPFMRSVVSLLLAGLLLSGCVASQSAGGGGAGASLLDSLRSEVATLQDRNRALRDSIRFLQGIESGAYYRETRALRDQLTRMSYELGALRDGGQTVTVIGADSLFEPASATLTEQGTKRLRIVANQLRQTYPNREIRVEGHSDSQPLSEEMKEKYPSNWELSCARASAVVRTLASVSGLDGTQFVAVGYGATDPVASNETATGRQRNRRVRVAVLPTPRDYSRPFETTW
jgi:chemotaxis protein MotB